MEYLVSLSGFFLFLILICISYIKGQKFIEEDIKASCSDDDLTANARKSHFAVEYQNNLRSMLSFVYIYIQSFARITIYVIIAFCVCYVLYILMYRIINTPIVEPDDTLLPIPFAAFFNKFHKKIWFPVMRYCEKGAKLIFIRNDANFSTVLLKYTPKQFFSFMNIADTKILQKHVFVFIAGLIFSVIYGSTVLPTFDESEICKKPNLDKLLKSYDRGFYLVYCIIIGIYITLFIIQQLFQKLSMK